MVAVLDAAVLNAGEFFAQAEGQRAGFGGGDVEGLRCAFETADGGDHRGGATGKHFADLAAVDARPHLFDADF